jgi:hypothetical protein
VGARAARSAAVRGDSPLYFMLENGLPAMREVARMLVREVSRASPASLSRRTFPPAREAAPALYYWAADANVAELVDAPDLGSGGVTRASSSLAFRTTHAREQP